MKTLRVLGLALVITTLSFWSKPIDATSDKYSASTQDKLAQDVALAPCKDKERKEAVKSLLVKMGAAPEDVAFEKLDGIENVVLRKKGQSEEEIIIGAHYDKTAAGCGAIDNWTGIVAIAHTYRSIRTTTTQKSLTFVAFGGEERGLLGSKAFARKIRKEDAGRYCAMVNVDSLGMAADPQVAENMSSKALSQRAVEVALRLGMRIGRIEAPGAGADSVPFVEKRIPAVTLSALGDLYGEVLHTNKDQVARVNMTSVHLGYRLMLELLAELDGLACDANRDGAAKK
ncbi:MAG: M20/M25/M40 family metallo-hydrolase [Acidobacteriota bacterium]